MATVLATAGTLAAQNLMPAGTLRAVFLGSNPVQGRIDPKTGEASGPVAELMRELARRFGVPFSRRGAANVKAVIDAVQKGEADAGFLALDLSRASDVAFSRAWYLVQNNYLVAAGSPLTNTDNIDREGVRVGVEGGISADLFLTRTLHDARLVRTAALPSEQILQILTSREIDAWAANKQRLVEMTAGKRDFRVLADPFLSVEQSMIVAKDNPQLLKAVDSFLAEALASGLIQIVLDRAGLSGVAVVRLQ